MPVPQPYLDCENFNLTAALAPGRVDLGGKAGGLSSPPRVATPVLNQREGKRAVCPNGVMVVVVGAVK